MLTLLVDRLEASLVSLTAAMDALQEELQSVSESNSKLADQGATYHRFDIFVF